MFGHFEYHKPCISWHCNNIWLNQQRRIWKYTFVPPSPTRVCLSYQLQYVRCPQNNMFVPPLKSVWATNYSKFVPHKQKITHWLTHSHAYIYRYIYRLMTSVFNCFSFFNCLCPNCYFFTPDTSTFWINVCNRTNTSFWFL